MKIQGNDALASSQGMLSYCCAQLVSVLNNQVSKKTPGDQVKVTVVVFCFQILAGDLRA